jgi:hypothetical protein
MTDIQAVFCSLCKELVLGYNLKEGSFRCPHCGKINYVLPENKK